MGSALFKKHFLGCWGAGAASRVGSKRLLNFSPILKHPTWTRSEVVNEEHDTVLRKRELLAGIAGGVFLCHKTKGYRKKVAWKGSETRGNPCHFISRYPQVDRNTLVTELPAPSMRNPIRANLFPFPPKSGT